jgi:hypothetical protein
VKTTLLGVMSAGVASIKVSNPSGITNGGRYVLRGISSPNYQLIIAGAVTGSAVALQSPQTLDFNFANGDVFRDEFLWDCILGEEGNMKIDFRGEKGVENAWSFTLDCFEDPTT